MRWLAAFFVSFLAAHALSQPQYEVVDLTAQFGEDFSAKDINNNGVVLGSMRLNFSQSQACVAQNGKLTMLPMFQGKHPWHALAINDNGDVLGAGTLGTGTYRTVLYRNGVVIDTGLLGSSEFAAGRNLDSKARIVGSIPDSIDPDAFIWENGVTTILSALGTGSDGANDISENGVVAGFSTVPGGASYHATRWENGQIQDLHPAWARDSMAVAVNDSGDVAGWGFATTGGQRGVIWESGIPIELGDFGGGQSRAYDLNAMKDVVGWGTDAIGVTHAFLWREGQMHRATDLLAPGHGLGFSLAESINDVGQFLAPGGEVGSTGPTHWYVFNPVPEPGSLLCVSFGLIVITISRRLTRRR